MYSYCLSKRQNHHVCARGCACRLGLMMMMIIEMKISRLLGIVPLHITYVFLDCFSLFFRENQQEKDVFPAAIRCFIRKWNSLFIRVAYFRPLGACQTSTTKKWHPSAVFYSHMTTFEIGRSGKRRRKPPSADRKKCRQTTTENMIIAIIMISGFAFTFRRFDSDSLQAIRWHARLCVDGVLISNTLSKININSKLMSVFKMLLIHFFTRFHLFLFFRSIVCSFFMGEQPTYSCALLRSFHRTTTHSFRVALLIYVQNEWAHIRNAAQFWR